MRTRIREIIALFLAVLLILAMLSGCGNKNRKNDTNSVNNSNNISMNQTNQQQVTVTLYFTDKDYSKLVTESRKITLNDDKDIVQATLDELFKGPFQPGHVSAIPANAKLLKVARAENIVTVDVSKEFDVGDIQEIVARIMIANTLASLPGIKYVKFYKEGEEYIGASGEPLGLMTKTEDIQAEESLEKASSLVNDDKVQKVNMILYFAGIQAMYIIPEVREVTVVGHRFAEAAINELIKGPSTPGLYPTIPNGTKLISVNIENDGTAVVNFSKEFKENHPGGTTGEAMTINSIVDTLTEFPSIKQVKFLIEGKEEETLAGHVIFNEPFKRNENIIGQRIVLYFSNKDGSLLVPEYRDVSQKETRIANKIVQELIKGPIDPNLVPTIPPGVTEKDLIDINIQGDTAFVNFSKALRDKHVGGSAAETLTVYSIVNSLTELPNIKRVQILIDGQKQESLVGHMALNEPIMRNPGLIQK